MVGNDNGQLRTNRTSNRKLDEIKELVHEKSLSLRDGATWLHYKTGRKLSHVGLKKIID